MSNLKQAIAVGQYPAPCFDAPGEPKEKQHRRFLRGLAQQGMIRLVDSAGYALDVNAVVKGAIHYKEWHVDAQGAQVILEQIEIETVRQNEVRRLAALAREEEERRTSEEQEADRRRNAEERKARRAELKAAGSWTHPRYRTLKAARADGWHRLKKDEYGGEQISLKGHTLVRNPKVAQSKTWWEAAGYSVKPGEQPHAQRTGQYVVYDVYRDDQVEPTPTVAEERLCLDCRNRLPLDRFLENERICRSCWSQRDEQEALERANQRINKQIEKDRRDYLKKTGFLPH